jgi:hypothetical protein
MKNKEISEVKSLQELNEKMQAVENLLILQLIQNGATTEQISTVLKVSSINPSNISDSLPVKKLQKREAKK